MTSFTFGTETHTTAAVAVTQTMRRGKREGAMRIAWRALFGGDIGPIGWCGQVGYWWTRPCRHSGAGCGWFDGVKVLVLDTGEAGQ